MHHHPAMRNDASTSRRRRHLPRQDLRRLVQGRAPPEVARQSRPAAGTCSARNHNPSIFSRRLPSAAGRGLPSGLALHRTKFRLLSGLPGIVRSGLAWRPAESPTEFRLNNGTGGYYVEKKTEACDPRRLGWLGVIKPNVFQPVTRRQAARGVGVGGNGCPVSPQ